MERDVQIAHGNTRFLKQKFYDDSDHYIVNIDRDTGLLAIGDPDNLTLRDSQRDVKKAAMPYSLKLYYPFSAPLPASVLFFCQFELPRSPEFVRI